MKLLLVILAIATIPTQVPAAFPFDSSASQTTDGGGQATSQQFRDRFTPSPELPGLFSPTVNETSSSASSIEDVGGSSSDFRGSDAEEPSSSRGQSVGSDEGYSMENSSSSGDASVGSVSGSAVTIQDDASASQTLDAGSGGASARSIDFVHASTSMEMIFFTAAALWLW